MIRIQIVLILLLLSIVSCYYNELTYNLTILGQGNGTVNPAGKIRVYENKTQTISAVPDTDYNVIGWEIVYGSGVSIDNALDAETTVTLTESDAVIQAIFTDIEGPVGSFTINEGNENTITTMVTLFNSITGAIEMRFGNIPGEVNDAPWEFYAATKEWTLSTGVVIKTVLG